MTLKGFLPGYSRNILSPEGRERYFQKLKYINDVDPYEIPRNEWVDDLDTWPAITYIHVGMYLLFKESPYTQDQLMNYKSLQCYKNFANGWVREIAAKEYNDKRLMIAKVSKKSCFLHTNRDRSGFPSDREILRCYFIIEILSTE